MKRRDFLRTMAALAGLGLLKPEEIGQVSQFAPEEVTDEVDLAESSADHWAIDGIHPYMAAGTTFRFIEEETPDGAVIRRMYSPYCTCAECEQLRKDKPGWLL